MADSKELLGGIVLSMMACLFGLSIQLSFVSSKAPEESWSSRIGSASLSARDNEDPIARTMIFLGCVPVTIMPPTKALSPVWTKPRVEMLEREFTVLTVACIP